MKSVLEELWYGNLCPDNKCPTVTKETRSLIGSIADCHDALFETLSEDQKELLEKFDDRYAELTSINEREVFVYAFKLGARMAMEIMNFDI